MEFGVLGPLRVTGDVPVAVSAARLRVLLAVLLWRANQPVPVDELAELVWDGAPSAGAKALYVLVLRLRRVLGETAGARIVTRPPGYVIELDEAELDASRFEALARQAGADAAARRWEQAGQVADQALGLWRGTPLADVSSQSLRDRWVPYLEQTRIQTLEWRIEAGLHQGRHGQLIGELRQLTGEHPLRERFQGQLMLALARSGRQAEALAAYHQARRVLVEELGIEPGPELRRLHEQILAGDAALVTVPPEPAASGGSARAAGAVVPRQLPPAVRSFVGRQAELGLLDKLAGQAGGPGTVVISTIGGTAGVGKTALALQWAHQVAHRFPDGQLYVNLRGFDPSGTPGTPAEAIRRFLDALGVPPAQIPPAPEAQESLYRSLLADKQMLIVLDNARDEAQVRPLLPASPASLVLVTSRSQFTGLAAADSAQLVSLDVLAHDEAVQLLTARLGASRAAAEPGAIGEIAALCARLPLALAVAAAQAAARPSFPLTQLAAELRGAADRLDALDAGDPAASIRAVFSWSYRQLSPEAARMFRLLGLHPGPDISIPAAASLAAAGEPGARRLLRELARDCLITEHAPGRYAFHDLLRAYAASQARDCDPETDRDAATSRILDHYLHTASHSATLLMPSREAVALASPSPGTRPEKPADHRQALAWFEAEHQVLLAAITLATGTGADSHAWQLPWAITGYLHRRGYRHERVTVMASALAAATRLDDPLGQARSLRGLGHACITTGDHDQARAHLERCLPLFQRLGDRAGEAWAQHSLAVLAEAQCRYTDGLSHNEQALRLFKAVGLEAPQAQALANVAWFHALLGDYPRARGFCEQALALIAKLGGSSSEHNVWDTLGYIELHLGNFVKAAEHFEVALGLCRDDGNRFDEAAFLIHAGDARHAAGELQRARQAWQQALAIYDDIHHPGADQVRAKLNGIGAGGGARLWYRRGAFCRGQHSCRRTWSPVEQPGLPIADTLARVLGRQQLAGPAVGQLPTAAYRAP